MWKGGCESTGGAAGELRGLQSLVPLAFNTGRGLAQ